MLHKYYDIHLSTMKLDVLEEKPSRVDLQWIYLLTIKFLILMCKFPSKNDYIVNTYYRYDLSLRLSFQMAVLPKNIILNKSKEQFASVKEHRRRPHGKSLSHQYSSWLHVCLALPWLKWMPFLRQVLSWANAFRVLWQAAI